MLIVRYVFSEKNSILNVMKGKLDPIMNLFLKQGQIKLRTNITLQKFRSEQGRK